MFKKSDKEKRLLAECADEGFRLLDENFRSNPQHGFDSGLFVPHPAGLAGDLGDYLYSNNPDLFYSSLSLMHATRDERVVQDAISRKDVKADLDRTLGIIEKDLYRESDFERRLAANIARHTVLGDEEIKREFSARFDVSPVDMLSLPTDRSIYFAKVNHGYWEYLRTAYDDAEARREQFREIDVRSKVRRLRSSGATQFWGRQVYRYFTDRPAAENRHVSLSVSLTAGTESPALTLRKGLDPITRGAAIGLMSMFETALPEVKRYALGDGGATRTLIFDRTLELFFEKYISDSEACVLVTPPHLRQVDFVGYKGQVYKFIVPPTRINETWKTVTAALLGYLVRLGKRHRSITVLGQGASIVSLMSLLFSDMDALRNVRLRYFDLGRVLDVAVPDFLQKQAWAKKGLEEHVAEGKKVFRNVDDAGCVLATLP